METEMDNRIKLLKEEIFNNKHLSCGVCRAESSVQTGFEYSIMSEDFIILEPILHKYGLCLGRLFYDGYYVIQTIEDGYKKGTANKYSDIKNIYNKWIRPKKLKEIFI